MTDPFAKTLYEIELMKKLASKYAKLIDGNKNDVSQAFREIYKCWSAFTKYLRKQVEQDGKTVEWQGVAKFGTENGTLFFSPCPSYLE